MYMYKHKKKKRISQCKSTTVPSPTVQRKYIPSTLLLLTNILGDPSSNLCKSRTHNLAEIPL